MLTYVTICCYVHEVLQLLRKRSLESLESLTGVKSPPPKPQQSPPPQPQQSPPPKPQKSAAEIMAGNLAQTCKTMIGFKLDHARTWNPMQFFPTIAVFAPCTQILPVENLHCGHHFFWQADTPEDVWKSKLLGSLDSFTFCSHSLGPLGDLRFISVISSFQLEEHRMWHHPLHMLAPPVAQKKNKQSWRRRSWAKQPGFCSTRPEKLHGDLMNRMIIGCCLLTVLAYVWYASTSSRY